MSATTLSPARLRADVRDVLVCAAAGGLAGLVVGGIGGRLAMFLLRLASSDVLHGMLTDDQFEVGSFTRSTFLLLAFTGAAGALGGAVYGAVRPFLALPPVAVAIVAGGLIGGSTIIHPGGLDFTFLDPLWLAVAMFIALPAAGAAAIVVLAERWLAGTWWGRDRRRTVLSIVPMVGVVPLAPFTLPVAAVAAMSVVARRRGLDGHPALRVAVAGVVVVACAVAAVALANDLSAVL